jgi:GNAT superfamily N-acetyltransferase
LDLLMNAASTSRPPGRNAHPVRAAARALGLSAKRFHYVLEQPPPGEAQRDISLPPGFEFCVLGASELQHISEHPERAGYASAGFVLNCLARGDTCLGIRRGDAIVAFGWYSLTHNHSPHWPVPLGADEAYLYDMYVFKAWRGHELAPALRLHGYRVLAAQGRSRFYSITECRNGASLRFKRKLGARILFTGLYVTAFNRYRWRWVLRRGEPSG